MGILREKMLRDMSVRNFAANTVESYLRSVRDLAKHYMISPDRLTQEQLLDYIYFLIKERKLASGSINAVTAGLRFFYKETMGMEDLAMAIPPRKTPRKLPEILSAGELSKLFSVISNQKHRVMLMTAYAAGLRISEVINLKVGNIDSGRMSIQIKNSKGRKDRYTILSPRLLFELRAYWNNYRPKDILFPSPVKDGPLDRAAPSLAFRKYKDKAEITKAVTFHSLRHTFATNLLEAGADIRTIQILLGHSSITSTAIYLHVARQDLGSISSPLDLIDLSALDRFKVQQ
ncbi:MAG: site-specific integrase [Victivallales bacterium]|nr:site-specific integrase [Victivallales bacterium]